MFLAMQTFDLMQIASEEWLIVMLVFFLLGRCVVFSGMRGAIQYQTTLLALRYI